MNTPTTPSIPPRQTPKAASFVFTFVNSLGTYVVTSSGLYFLTSKGFGFSEFKNYLLAVLLGITYIVGAKAAAHAKPALASLVPGFSHRGLLAVLMVALGGLCLLPYVAGKFAKTPVEAEWSVWVLVLLYSPLMGVLWPVVETYISGGRSDADLRGTMGWWNVVWSAAGIASTFMIAPMVTFAPALAMALVTAVHLSAAGCLPWFTPEPAPHLDGHHEPHPPVYAKLLVTFQWLLPMGYIVMSALGPYLPYAARKLELAEGWHAYVPAAWIGPRVVMFAVMHRWQGWHGSWSIAIASGVGLVASFAVAISATLIGGTIGVVALLVGLTVFGAAMAVIYTAALYYALEVGRSDVDAGGTHEALIGVGYTVGPGLGLLAWFAASRGVITEDTAQGLVLGAVLLLAGAVTAIVARRVKAVERATET